MFNTLIFLAFLCREQPPLRGCVLKLNDVLSRYEKELQPPLRGCVLKLFNFRFYNNYTLQPPLRGCVLKQLMQYKHT